MSESTPAARWIPLAVFAALALLLAAGVWLSRNPDREALPSPLIDKPAPQFALPVLHEPDRKVTLADLKGAPFVLNVWGSWCPSCRDEHPVLTRFAETKRVRVVGFNWKDEPDDARRWLDQFGNPYWVVIADIEGKSAIEFESKDLKQEKVVAPGAKAVLSINALKAGEYKFVDEFHEATAKGKIVAK